MVRRGGSPGRPPVKKAHVSVSPRARVIRSLPSAPRRPEGIRWLRSDGSPNWSQRIYEGTMGAASLASRPAIGVYTSSTILEAVETMAEHRVRGLVVTDAKSRLNGLLTSTDIVNYLGGGEYYNIVVNRYKGNIFAALREERVISIANPSPISIRVDAKLDEILETIVREGVGILPVINYEGVVYGIITEHDVVRALGKSRVGVKVGDIASKNIVAVGIEEPIKRAAELMIRHGFRRLPVIGEDGSIKGIVTAKDLVALFGTHKAFEYATTGNIEEVLKIPVYEVMSTGVITIESGSDVSDAIKIMEEYGVSGLIVVDENDNAIGIVTERDMLIAIAIGGRG